MDDREKDLALLKSYCTERRLPGWGVIGIALFTFVIIWLALWSSFLGSWSLILLVGYSGEAFEECRKRFLTPSLSH